MRHDSHKLFKGHGQTAARLQRDWGRPDPEMLSFAPNVPTRALVSLLQKGLRYHELESSLNQARCTNEDRKICEPRLF